MRSRCSRRRLPHDSPWPIFTPVTQIAEQARVNALVSDPATLRALQAQQAPRPIQPDGTFAPLPALPTFASVDAGEESTPPTPAGPPSSGRQISPPRQRY